MAGVDFYHPLFCQCCQRPLAYAIGDHICRSCFAEAAPLAEIQSCFLYTDQSRQLILKLKRDDALYLNPLFARFFASAFYASQMKMASLPPMPLCDQRLVQQRPD